MDDASRRRLEEWKRRSDDVERPIDQVIAGFAAASAEGASPDR